jgi:hypothetical protein
MEDAKNNLTLRTLGVWRPRTAGRLSEEDARKIAENIAGFFTVLLEWEASEKEKQGTESDESYYAKSA